jgi:DNA polymerase-1
LQVIDVLGLWGDASDNIPGVPGVGEKTAKKLISTYGSVEGVLDHVGDLKGKQKEAFEGHREQALLCKRLATIATDAPVEVSWEQLLVEEPDKDALSPLFIELEFNALGRRVLGDGFKAGRGQPAPAAAPEGMATEASGQGMLFGFDVAPDGRSGPGGAHLRVFDATSVAYHLVDTEPACRELAARLAAAERFCFDTETTALDTRDAALVGLSFSVNPGEAWFVAVPEGTDAARDVLEIFRPVFAREGVLKIGQNLKYDLGVLLAHGIEVAGPFHDTMLAHGLTHPDQRHSMDYMSESLLGYSPVSITTLLGEKGPQQKNMRQAFAERPMDVCHYACEDADITLQLHDLLAAELKRQDLAGVFGKIEAPLLPVLVRMETEGIRVDTDRLRAIGRELQDLAATLQDRVIDAAGQPFNLNSPRQLGEILFEKLKLIEKPKKTKTGQYVTNEQVLAELAPRHAIVRDLLDYREAVKLKNTYVDTLPGYVHPRTGRVHTHFHQLVAATGRLASSDPNLQNIPVRTELGRGIRDAFVARDEHHLLLSADYSQIELRVMAALSADPALIDAFARDMDIHTATAARVYGVDVSVVDGEMRRRAKMVNFGIIYGISAFGLAQRLGIPRGEADTIIKSYFEQYPGVKEFMDRVVKEATAKGYVETMTGRRRHLPDLRSANQNIRSSAERVAINTPIQGTAADMIKLAMIRVDSAIREAGLKSRLLLQVHDELVLDMAIEEEEQLVPLVRQAMTTALPLPGVEVTVGIGKGKTWLEAH